MTIERKGGIDMLSDSPAFSGFSVNDIPAAEKFYGETLGLDVSKGPMGLELRTKGNNAIFIYEKSDHTPASYTILNFPVDDIDKTIDDLAKAGVSMLHYDKNEASGMPEQDDKGVLRGRSANMGPDIAWFKDPADNVLSILQN
jgi:predicted enzyme related to lactoylglutathione lyase